MPKNHLHNLVSTRQEPLIFRIGSGTDAITQPCVDVFVIAIDLGDDILFSSGFPCDWTVNRISQAPTHAGSTHSSLRSFLLRFSFFPSFSFRQFYRVRFSVVRRSPHSPSLVRSTLHCPYWKHTCRYLLCTLEFTWIRVPLRHPFVVGSMLARINNLRNEYAKRAHTKSERKRDRAQIQQFWNFGSGEKCVPIFGALQWFIWKSTIANCYLVVSRIPNIPLAERRFIRSYTTKCGQRFERKGNEKKCARIVYRK